MSSFPKNIDNKNEEDGAPENNADIMESIAGPSNDAPSKRIKTDEHEDDTRGNKSQRRSATPQESEDIMQDCPSLPTPINEDCNSDLNRSSDDQSPINTNANDSDSSSSSSSSDSDSSLSIHSIRMRMQRESAEKAVKDGVELLNALHKTKPKYKHIIPKEVILRERGFPSRSHKLKEFQNNVYGSLRSVERLELMYKLAEHEGCVNALDFSESGDLLASASDDLHLCLWNWATGKLISRVNTGHRSNVFQSKFLPLQGHTHIVTCGRDGDVRLLELDSSGLPLCPTRRLARHVAPAHKIAVPRSTPHCFYSCGEDSTVNHFDIRLPKPNSRITKTREYGKLVPLYTISCHPLDENEFLTGGKDQFIRLYDRRHSTEPFLKLSPFPKRTHQPAVRESPGETSSFLASGLSPDQETHRSPTYVSCAVYSYNGAELLASLNDDDIYLWDRYGSSTEFVHRYQGHRNQDTIKGVNFFGPRSEYVVSGSDCRHIYFWEKESEAIVQWLMGEEIGPINCVEPHPSVPVLATSGIDVDVKIWIASKEDEPEMEKLKETVRTNFLDREMDREEFRNGGNNSQMLWFLWQHLRSGQLNTEDAEEESDEYSSVDSSDNEELNPNECPAS